MSAAQEKELALTEEQQSVARFYEREYPDVDECVMVQVKSIAEMGAYVTLLEYGNIEGMILLSELSRRRIRSVNKHIRVGRMEHAIVVRVDSEKGYIDLSKRRVTPEDVAKCEERYNKAKAVASIVWHVAEQSGKPMLEINKMVTWPLAKKYKTAYEALRLAMANPDEILGPLNLEPSIRSLFMADIKKRLTPQAVKIRADIEVSCFTVEGIDAVRSALMAGLKSGTEEIPIKINLIAPPLYVMLTSSLDKVAGIQALEKAITAIDEVIKARGGIMKIKMAPRATTSQEENALAKELERMEQENKEVDGDDEDGDADYADTGIIPPSKGGNNAAADNDDEEDD
jgi:translation initiation factor 2 subunit 1